MLQQIELSDTEILLAFAASCVEGTARLFLIGKCTTG